MGNHSLRAMGDNHRKPLTESHGDNDRKPSLRAMEDNHRKPFTESNGGQAEETPH